MQGVDFIIISIVSLSVLFAFVRGFTGEMLKIGTWVAASVVGIYMVPDIQPGLASFIPNPMLANAVAFMIVGIVSWILLRKLCGWISYTIKQSSLNGLDHILGAVYGLVRGIIYLFLFYFLVIFLAPHRADEFRESSSIFQKLDETGEQLREHFSETVTEYLNDYLEELGAEGVDISEVTKQLSKQMSGKGSVPVESEEELEVAEEEPEYYIEEHEYHVDGKKVATRRRKVYK